VGRISWVDLTVPDALNIRDFYCKVVGWDVQELTMEDAGESYADYVMVGGDGKAAAGVCHARGMNQSLPPTWLIYLPVGDIAESLRRVRDEGGQIIKDCTGGDSGFSYAVIQDPVGAILALGAG
jgi:predicted enzyme related to lactoylglutathione lyase